MFFILNNENAVLAADDAFLESVGTTHIFLLAERFRFGDFQLDEENRTCLISGKTRTFTKSSIQTILGGGSLYRIDEEAPRTVSEETIDQTDRDADLSISAPVAEPDIPPHESVKETEDTDTVSLSTPDQPEATTSLLQREISDLPEPETILSTVTSTIPETPEPGAPVSEADTLTLSTPDLPEAFESEEEKEDDLLAMLDEETIPTTPSEEVALPDWLETQDEPAAPDTPEPAASAPQKHEDEALPDLLDLEEETSDIEHTSPQSEADDEPDLLEVLNEPDILETPEPVVQASKKDEEEDLLDLLDLDEEVPTAPSITSTPTPPHEAEEDLFDLLDMDEEDTTPAPVTQTSATPPPLDDILSLKEEGATSAEEASLTLKEETTASQPTAHAETYQIGDAPLADYQANAKVIGITPDEYLGFLRQFTDESLQYQAGLKSNDLYLFKKNLLSIKDASQLLHLPQLSQTLEHLEESTSDEREQLIDYFYDMVQHIRRDLDQDTAPSTEQTPPEPVAESKPESPEAPPPAAPSFTFDSVEPIPFDFSAKAASDELGLPESLVQEFVSDFVQQAKENISVFEEAQRTNDIDTIQKTAHLLKGAASNLRIDPLAETLKALQYNESPSAVPELFQTFVGQLKTLVQFTEN